MHCSLFHNIGHDNYSLLRLPFASVAGGVGAEVDQCAALPSAVAFVASSVEIGAKNWLIKGMRS